MFSIGLHLDLMNWILPNLVWQTWVNQTIWDQYEWPWQSLKKTTAKKPCERECRLFDCVLLSFFPVQNIILVWKCVSLCMLNYTWDILHAYVIKWHASPDWTASTVKELDYTLTCMCLLFLFRKLLFFKHEIMSRVFTHISIQIL